MVVVWVGMGILSVSTYTFSTLILVFTATDQESFTLPYRVCTWNAWEGCKGIKVH